MTFFSWKAKPNELDEATIYGPYQDGIPKMTNQRFLATSVLNENGDIWVIGGISAGKRVFSDSTEVYKYKPRGEGQWLKGAPIPDDYRDTGIVSHCTVR